MLCHSNDFPNRRADYVALAKLSCSILQSGGGRETCAADFLELFYLLGSFERGSRTGSHALSGRYPGKRNPIEHQSKTNPKLFPNKRGRNGRKFANSLFAQ
jgi:hypothetical protein